MSKLYNLILEREEAQDLLEELDMVCGAPIDLNFLDSIRDDIKEYLDKKTDEKTNEKEIKSESLTSKRFLVDVRRELRDDDFSDIITLDQFDENSSDPFYTNNRLREYLKENYGFDQNYEEFDWDPVDCQSQ